MSQEKNEIVLYKSDDGPEIMVNVEGDTVWLSQAEISQLFGTQRPAITKHLKNIFSTGELSEKSVSSVLEHTAQDGKNYQVKAYNLDAVLAVGYRVNSKRATQFRIWATQKLREYLMKGYVVNELRLREAQDLKLKELQQAHKFIQQALETKRLEGYEKELGNIINDYTQTWVTLSRFDEGDLELDKSAKKIQKELDYERAKKTVEHFKARMMETEHVSGVFGRETGTKLAEILDRISEMAAGIEEKGAEIFYSIIKERPFLDGNKRIGALLFVLFLIENNQLYDKKGQRKFNDTALTTLALLIEETKPGEKSIILALIANLVSKR